MALALAATIARMAVCFGPMALSVAAGFGFDASTAIGSVAGTAGVRIERSRLDGDRIGLHYGFTARMGAAYPANFRARGRAILGTSGVAGAAADGGPLFSVALSVAVAGATLKLPVLWY